MSNQEPAGIRLQKVMASAGVASRRVCEDLIAAGKVRVNDRVVTEQGTRVDPTVDRISVNGMPIQLDASRVYLALNKPRGVMSTMADENGRPDLSQFVVGYDRVFNVGRLDAETTGLLIMTNDGDLAHKLAHPKFGVEKTYLAKVSGRVEPSIAHKLLSGFDLEDGFIKADRAHIVDISESESLIEVTLHSGRNRIVRRMFDFLEHPVISLVRRQFGPIHLGPLKEGRIRELNKMEVSSLLKAADEGFRKSNSSKRTAQTKVRKRS